MGCVNVVKEVVEKMSQSKSSAVDSVMDEWIRALPDALNEKLINSVAQSHWYSFYDAAFDKLLTNHWYICTIAVAVITIFMGLKLYQDHCATEKMIEEKQKEFEKKINQSMSNSMNDIMFMQNVVENKVSFLQNLMAWKNSNRDETESLNFVNSVCKNLASMGEIGIMEAYCHFIEKEFDSVYEVINQMTDDKKRSFMKSSMLFNDVLENKLGDLGKTLRYTEFRKYINAQLGLNEPNSSST